MINNLFGDGRYRVPHSDESRETAENDSLMQLLEIVPADAISRAKNRWMDQGPLLENSSGVLGATALVAAKRSLVSSGAVDRRLDFHNLLAEHPELEE